MEAFHFWDLLKKPDPKASEYEVKVQVLIKLGTVCNFIPGLVGVGFSTVCCFFRLKYPIVLGRFWKAPWLQVFLLLDEMVRNSHHQDFAFLVGDPYKPKFGAISGKVDNPTYTLWFLL